MPAQQSAGRGSYREWQHIENSEGKSLKKNQIRSRNHCSTARQDRQDSR